jgi:hypothetical protein
MKRNDLMIIIVVVIVSGTLSFVLCNQLIVPKKAKSLSAEVVTPITDQFELPDKTVFNDDAINPTKLIQIAPNSNGQPFGN